MSARTAAPPATGSPTTRPRSSPAHQAAVAAAVQAYEFPGERVGRVTLRVPPGRYRITQPEAFMAAVTGSTIMGLNIDGAGQAITEIVFAPTTAAGSYLLRNTRWRQLTFRDLSFFCATPGASFMASARSDAGYAIQDYRFERVLWGGAWQYGINLSGLDNNDSITWEQCSIHGSWSGGFLYSGTSDQFLNYNFNNCKVEMASGKFCVLPYGGSVNCVGGSYLFYDTTQPGVFFDVPYTPAHADGTQRLLVIGMRAELRGLNHKLTDCHWTGGVVHFDQVDDSAHAGILAGAATMQPAIFHPHGGGGPIVLWTSCALVGQHVYRWTDGDYQRRPLVKYDSCVFRSWDEPTKFVITEPETGAGNVGGAAPVELVNCRGGNTATPWLYPPDATMNWSSSPAQVKRRAVTFKSPFGGLPFDGLPTLDVWLPLGAMVTGVRFRKKAGSGSSAATGWSYAVRTSEGTPTVLGQVAGGGSAQWVNGFSSHVPVDNFVCDTDARRHLVLVAAGIDQITLDSIAIVEYYG